MKTSPTPNIDDGLTADLRRFIRCKVGNPADVEEILNTTLLQLAGIVIRENRNGCAFIVAARQVSQFYRHRRRKPQLVGGEAYEVAVNEAAIPYDQYAAIDARDFLERVTEDLPDNQRAAALLVYSEGLSYEDAAKRLGLKTNTFKKHLAQALAGMRRKALILKLI